MASLRKMIPLAGAALASTFDSCSSDLPFSCQNTTSVADTCCFIPAGQILQTQFWDTNPVAGPTDSWTIHGLWPDYCDGTYPEFCDSSREYASITDIVTKFSDESTLSYMDTYWVSDDGDNESFWEHEWNKHGTCISTLETSCYSNYQTSEEAADYIEKTIEVFKTLPTYEWLKDAGITPSSSDTYTSSEILAALKAGHGAEVTIRCSSGYLNEVWYHFNVKGSLQEGEFAAVDPDGSKSSCPTSGVKYAPKN